MKFLQLYCFIVFSISVIADQLTSMIEAFGNLCRDIIEIDQILIDEAQNGEFSDNEKIKDYYQCFGQRIGYIRLESYEQYSEAFKTVIPKLKREALRNWLVNKLRYDSETTGHTFESCGIYDRDDRELFEPIKCLSENKLPVDVVSANFVDQSVENLNRVQNFCKKKLGVYQNLIAEAQKGNIDVNIDDPEHPLIRYYSCFSYMADFLETWGELKIFVLESWLKHFMKYDSDKVNLALQKCYKPQIEEAVELLKIVKCFHDEHVPIDVLSANFADQSVVVLNKIKDFCKKTLNVDPNLITEAQKGNIEANNQLMAYYICFSNKAGFLGPTGEISLFILETWLKYFLKYDLDKVELALEKCYKPEIEEAVEFLKIVKCFVDEHVLIDVLVIH